MKTSRLLLLFLIVMLSAQIAFGQRGKIIKAATTSVMDPNGDGFVSKTSAGFTDGKGYWVDEFELPMFGIPQLKGDATGDNIGDPCGITDLIPDKNGFSVYALRKNDAQNNVIFRFRVGNNNPSVEAWTILLDTDGLFGIGEDPNATKYNPGFELDITLIKRQNAGIRIYDIDGTDKCGKEIAEFSYDNYFQISIADEVSCGDLDYFYDFYVPFNQVAAAFNAANGTTADIDATTGMRYVAVTNTSATCAMSGKISDVSGIDDNEYPCIECAFEELIEAQCPTAIVDLCETCLGFATGVPKKPTINTPIKAGQTSISGTAQSGIFIKVSVFSRTGGTDAAPVWSNTAREEKVVSVLNSTWTANLLNPLLAYDKIVARSQINMQGTGCGSSGTGSETSTSVTVVEPNAPPVAQPKSLNTDEDTPKPIVLLASDPDGNPISYSIVSQPANGKLSGVAPNITYTPNQDFNGSDVFVFKANDGILNSNNANVVMNVVGANDAPVAQNKTINTNEDTPVSITLTATDADGDVLTYVLVTQPLHGTISGTGVNRTYTPNLNYFGTDSFTFKANDGTVDSNVGTVVIKVKAVAEPPVANDQSIITDEDTPVDFVLDASDPDGGFLDYNILNGPTNGTLSGTAPDLTYTPNANFNGTDSFEYVVIDGTSQSDNAIVTITVNPINDDPIADDQTVTVIEDTPKTITLSASDVDGDALTYTIVTPPVNGSLIAVSGAGVIYTPNANYVGPDSFTFKANDGTIASNEATVTIEVVPGNDAPVAVDQSVVTAEDTAKPFTLNVTDQDGDALTYVILTAPTHGVLSGTAPDLVYTPALNYNGSDSFTYKANDGSADSNVATVSITVTPVNDAPIASDVNVAVTEEVAKEVTMVATDIENDPLTYVIVNQPQHGTLSVVNGNKITYTPNANYFGPDSFTYKVNDGTLDSNIATVFISVGNTNDAPVAINSSVTVIEDTPKVIVMSASDADGDLLTYSIVALPAHGNLSVINGNQVTYSPAANYVGPDSFTFRVNDGTVFSNTATISINVVSFNDSPIVFNQTVVYNTLPVNFTLQAFDPEGDALIYSILTNPAQGSISGVAPALTYTPAPADNGTYTLTYKVNDGNSDSNIGLVTFVFDNGVNDAPVAEDQSVTISEDSNKTITLVATDADGDPLTYTIVTPPTHGSLVATADARVYVYTPSLNYTGSDSFVFRASDGTLSDTGTISITITAVNDAPVAFNQSVVYTINAGTALTLTGADADGDVITFTVLTQPAHGTLSGSGSGYTYTPNLNYSGLDSFTFRVNDGSVDSNIATISLTASTANSSPIAAAQSVTTNEDTPVTINLSATDANADPLVYTIITPPFHGTLSCNNCANPIYTPALNYNGSDSFTFKANDGTIDSNVATVSITINPVGDVPVANNQSVTVQEDVAQVITLTGSDGDGDVLTYTVLTSPTKGTLTGTAPNLTYTPQTNYFGADSFTFKVNDGTTDSNIATVTINVLPVNDAPVAGNSSTTTIEDVSVTVNIVNNGSDVDGAIDPATVDLDPSTPAEDKTFTVPGQGTYTVDNSGNLTFTPAPNYNGTTTPISYTVKDNGGGVSAPATIQVIVTPVNDPPVIVTTVVNVNEDETSTICITVTDVEGDPTSLTEVVSLSGNGSVVLDSQSGQLCFKFTPKEDFSGPVQVKVTVCETNNTAVCTTKEITVNVNPVNDPPSGLFNGVPGNKVTMTTPEDVPLDFCFDVFDKEGNTISVSTITPVSGGGTMTSGTHGTNKLCFTFLPAADFNGKSVWEIEICDNGVPAACGKLTIEIDVTPVNDAPVATNQNVITEEDTPKAITLAATDVDGDVLAYTIVTLPVHGSLSCTTCAAPVYTPAANYSGADSFSYKANDGTVDSNVATVNITVTPLNDAPIISTIPVIYVPEDSVVQICIGATDAEGDGITYNQPTNVSGGGSMTRDNEFGFCFNFRPAKDFNGESTWKFTVCDNATPPMCSEKEVKIVVTPVNDPPVAVNDLIKAKSFKLTESVNILSNDRDIENDPLKLTVTPVAGPYHGTVTMKENGSFEYKSAQGFMGTDSVRYKVCDTGTPSLCDEGVVFIEVGPAPFKIYEGLSPNGDGLNDFWRIDGIEDYPNNTVRVFDRYNNLIFERKGYDNEQNSWTGQSNHSLVKGTMPEGTYYYIVDLGDGSELFKGYVVLKRE